MTAEDDDEFVRNPEQADEAPEAVLPAPQFTPPNVGELVTSSDTGNTYTIGPGLGEGFTCHHGHHGREKQDN